MARAAASRPPLLSIVIPVFNQWNLTAQCLDSLRANTPGSYFEVLIVDNGSIDETPSACRHLGEQLFPRRFTYLRNPENLGFGQACNQGARNASGELLLFLNNDTLMTENWATPLLHAMRDDSRLGAVGPLLLYPGSERVQHLGIVFWPGTTKHVYELFPRNHPVVTKRRHVQAITAAALLVLRRLFWACDGFYPGYKNGFEDLELCVRIREHGKNLACIPSSVVFHLTSQSAGRFHHDQDNAALLHARCPGKLLPDALRIVKKDGFTARITPWLSPFVALPEERTQALQKLLEQNPRIDRIMHLLEQEPLWADGYEFIAQKLEKKRKWKEAAEVRILQNHFAPSLAGYQKLLTYAVNADDPNLFHETKTALDNIAQRMRQAKELRSRAESAIRQCEKPDPELAALYEQWLKNQPSPLETSGTSPSP
ncbi:glycosyltransferase family 2 protein [Desulfonatronum parangueonense]